MAKDVSTFLTYLARPEMPDFKRYALKLAFMSLPVGFVLLYLKRFIWTTWKSQKVVFRPVKGREEWRAPRR
uniref:Uncharacterized protein n=1 Tax=Romanomermis culicivorax TaxID=13658 RepID=A0A915LBI8_ROMCU